MENFGCFLTGFLLSNIIYASQQDCLSWVAQVRKEAFADIHEPSRQVKGLARSQPEYRITFRE